MAVHCVKNHFRRTYFDKFMPTCFRGLVFYEAQCTNVYIRQQLLDQHVEPAILQMSATTTGYSVFTLLSLLLLLLLLGWWRGVVVTRLIRSMKLLYIGSSLGSISTVMGDCLWTGKPSRYVTSCLGQFSLSSLRGR